MKVSLIPYVCKHTTCISKYEGFFDSLCVQTYNMHIKIWRFLWFPMCANIQHAYQNMKVSLIPYVCKHTTCISKYEGFFDSLCVQTYNMHIKIWRFLWFPMCANIQHAYQNMKVSLIPYVCKHTTCISKYEGFFDSLCVQTYNMHIKIWNRNVLVRLRYFYMNKKSVYLLIYYRNHYIFPLLIDRRFSLIDRRFSNASAHRTITATTTELTVWVAGLLLKNFSSGLPLSLYRWVC